MTTLYLAYSTRADGTLERHAGDGGPVDLLVSFSVLRQFQRLRPRINVGRWVMDSGAYSVAHAGKEVRLVDYIAACKDVDAAEVFGLDVIGDPEATRRNLETMWAAGVPAIPAFHYGSPESALQWAAAAAPKIALGGVARMTRGRREQRYSWLRQCVARVWPKKIHAFGCGSWEAVRSAPFDSVDAASWTLAPGALGRWCGFTGRQIDLHGRGEIDLWVEVVEHRRRAAWAAERWAKELAAVRAAPDAAPSAST